MNVVIPVSITFSGALWWGGGGGFIWPFFEILPRFMYNFYYSADWPELIYISSQDASDV